MPGGGDGDASPGGGKLARKARPAWGGQDRRGRPGGSAQAPTPLSPGLLGSDDARADASPSFSPLGEGGAISQILSTSPTHALSYGGMASSMLPLSPTNGSCGEAHVLQLPVGPYVTEQQLLQWHQQQQHMFHGVREAGAADQGKLPRRRRSDVQSQFPSNQDSACAKRSTRAGQQQQQQAARTAQDAQLSQLKNHEITKQEPPWTEVTTVMMRNLPNKYCQQMLLEELYQHGFQLQVDFDFFYLPMDHTNAVNLGYCFINFVDVSVANGFAATFSGKRMRLFNSSKTVVVMPASIQGYDRNYAYYSAAKVSQAEDPQYRPIFVGTRPVLPSLPVLAHCMAPLSPTYVWHMPQMPMGTEDYSPVAYHGEEAARLSQQLFATGEESPPALAAAVEEYARPAGHTATAGAGPSSARLPLIKDDKGYDTDEEREAWTAQGLIVSPYDRYVQDAPPPDASTLPAPESLHLAPAPAPGGFIVRNTFLETSLPRSPSAERFLDKRLVKSCPASVPRSSEGSATIDDIRQRGGHRPVHEEGGGPQQWDVAVVTAAKLLEEASSSGGGSEERPEARADGSTRSVSSAGARVDKIGSAVGSVVLPSETSPSEAELAALGTQGYPCKGSAFHRWGACKPCAFFGNVRGDETGCRNGTECTFCHLCEPGEKKRRKRERLRLRREGP